MKVMEPSPLCFKQQIGSPDMRRWPLFNTFTEELTFLAAVGGTFTPTWKLARITADTSGSLLSAERTYTNDLIVTVGPVAQCGNETTPAVLTSAAQAQHNSKVTAAAIAVSISGH
jgi:hypothetical protein